MWLTIMCLSVIFMIKILHNWRRPPKFPPGPRGLPIVGNIFDVKRLVEETKFYSQAWCRLANIYGPIVGLKLGMANPLVIVSGRSAVVEMLNRPEFDGRPDGFAFRHRTGGVRRGVIFTDSDVWREQRRFTLKTLKQFGFGKITMEDLILKNAVALTNAIGSLATSGPIKNLHNITSIAVLNSLWTLVAGSSFDLDNPRLMEILSILNDIVRSSNITGGILNHLPFLRHILPGLTGFTLLNQKMARILQFLRSEVAKHKRTRIHGEFRDFIDVYLAEISAEQSKLIVSYFDEEQLISIVRDLFSAGVETTNNTIGFVITYLAVRQDVQRKLHEEIKEVLGKDTLPRIAHKNRLPYLNATIAEVWRMSNVGPTSIPHRATANTTLLGYEIKKDYTLLANFISVHMDEKHWGDPKEFRPERFINDEGEYVEDPWLMTFSLGRRKCLGETLARHSIFLFVACLLQKFRFVLPAGHPDPILDGIDGFTIAPPDISVLAIKNT
ncbi:methyl farnesoate epoxidase-like [Odontomachus brunneus]|uniref:methyl farnesoate epoxidase-like n=1 Tax=Odontomachus brunneus TaxID=486640 RepID=UPI0013F1CE9E|nr:methyl farnesoate epoxidase-like [Odontomachus brunneus]XP_032664142.1 methyl farnesoate epoxidase-like [Odontomachus brunneus]XP_032664143.1 methyl farnesoate epoxidase-like [Odontomachus brunneus]XP_032664144.1 methyl farnesoate epoxidase-like [Odontomachus brunneus]XP_032664145.1 methyl farnesoate epoxidase-like [Odontomachus brunneus]